MTSSYAPYPRLHGNVRRARARVGNKGSANRLRRAKPKSLFAQGISKKLDASKNAPSSGDSNGDSPF